LIYGVIVFPDYIYLRDGLIYKIRAYYESLRILVGMERRRDGRRFSGKANGRTAGDTGSE
jgi:hypothetical protein